MSVALATDRHLKEHKVHASSLFVLVKESQSGSQCEEAQEGFFFIYFVNQNPIWSNVAISLTISVSR